MRFGLIHRAMTDALAVLGLLALLSSGELNPVVSWSIVLGLLLSLFVPERWQDTLVMRRFSWMGPLALLSTQVTRLFMGAPLLETSVEFAAGLQVLRLATRRGAAHDQQVIVLALLHLIAGTVLGGGLAYGLCFIGFLIVTPGALVLSHLRREVEGNYRQGARDRTGLPVDVPRILRSRRVIGRSFLLSTCLLSVPIFLFTAALFVAFPRVGLSLLLLNHSRPERMVGFSDRVDLGKVGRLRSDPTIAMRVEYPNLPPDPPPRLALYLRGTAFDHYDGRSWSRTVQGKHRLEKRGSYFVLRRRPDPKHDRQMIIDLEPIDPPVLFLPPRAVSLRVLGRGTPPPLGRQPVVIGGPEGQVEYESSEENGLRYSVSLSSADRLPVQVLPAEDRARYLALPPQLSERILELARSWAGNRRNPHAIAKQIERRLRTEYRYDLDSPSGAVENPLEHFLFTSKRGHCEFYSTAMAVMLRALKIPSRNVTGFIGGTYNRFGSYYAVRQGDAHSWVEAFIEGRGWVRFDPTPPSDAAPQSEITGIVAVLRDLLEATAQRWNRHVVSYDLRQQVGLLQSVRAHYSELRSRSPLLKTTLGSPKRALIFIVGLGLIVFGAFWLIRQRKRPSPGQQRRSAKEIAAREVVGLYRALEAVMASHGIARLPSTPPLAHAQALAEMHHPLGDDVLELTQQYVEVRFGGRAFSEEDRREYQRRVRLLKQTRKTADAA